MKIRKNDNNSFMPYKHNDIVEDLVTKLTIEGNSKRAMEALDKALDEKLFITNPDAFKEIVDNYNKAKIINKIS